LGNSESFTSEKAYSIAVLAYRIVIGYWNGLWNKMKPFL